MMDKGSPIGYCSSCNKYFPGAAATCELCKHKRTVRRRKAREKALEGCKEKIVMEKALAACEKKMAATKWIVPNEEALEKLLENLRIVEGYAYAKRHDRRKAHGGRMMTYKCPRHLKSRLPPPIQPVPGMSMEEKLFLEYERRQSIPPKIRHYDDGPRHGIECPFTMHVEWLGPHGPICVGVGKGKAASHADNCEPILNKNNFVSKVKHLTQAVPGHGLSAWKMYEFTPTAAPTEPRPHEDVREIPTTPEPDANVLALLKELTVRISELPTEVKDVTISEVKNLLSELEEATGEKICPKESASRKKLKQKDWLGVKKINMKKPRADFPHKSNELNIRNYRQENTSEL